MQNFTSAIRKSKKVESRDKDDDDDDDDGQPSKKLEMKHKTSKERAIDKLQELETKNDDDDDNNDGRKEEKEEYEAYNGQVLEGASDDEEVGADWHSGKLKFRKHITDKLKVGGDGRRLDDYVLIDPRSKQ